MSVKERKPATIYWALIAIGVLLFMPFLGKVHLFDWDEINFAEAAREMLMTGNWLQVQIDFEPFYQKPPLFIWMQALSMSLFGVGEFAARFPNAVCGIATMLLLFHFGNQLVSKQFGLLWVLAYVGSFLPHFYFKSGIIDPWFNFFIFGGLLFLIIQYEKRSILAAVLSGAFIGLAVLTKGPVGLLIPMLVVIIFAVIKRSLILSISQWASWVVTFLIVSGSWFAIETIVNGPEFITAFIDYQIRLFSTEDAGHGGPFYYHFVVLLLGCFPASIFALSVWPKREGSTDRERSLLTWMWLILGVVLLVFSIVNTKIIHYSSLAYFPITFLAAFALDRYLNHQKTFSKLLLTSLAVIGLLWAFVITMVPVIGNNPSTIIPYIRDQFAVANLSAGVNWPQYLVLIGLFYLIVIIFSYRGMQRGLITGALTVFIGTIITTQVLLISFVPRIERYTQGAAIDFYKSKQNEDVYVEVKGFKSYAHLFYTKRTPDKKPEGNYLLNELGKPLYVITRIDQSSELEGFEELERKNGFVFLKEN